MKNQNNLIPPHGGYRKLKTFQLALTIFDLTKFFTDKWIKDWKQKAQMDGAARSGKQNIVEGSEDSGTSKKIELKLTNISRGSFEELLQDFEDFLAEKRLEQWKKDDPRAVEARDMRLSGRLDSSDWSDLSDKKFLDDPEKLANLLICLIHQENFLLDRQLKSLAQDFTDNGGFTERLYRERKRWIGPSCLIGLTVFGFFFFAHGAQAATYYVDNSCVAHNGNGSCNGTDPDCQCAASDNGDGPFNSIANMQAKAGGYLPDDNIYLKKGETFREQLTVPSSGSDGQPITFGAYGSGEKPIISGADVITGFSVVSGTVYSKSGITTQPKVVNYNGAPLTYNHVGSSISSNEWDWAANVLYVNVGGDPASSIEAGQRDYAVYSANHSYVTVDGFDLKGTNSNVVLVGGSWNGMILKNSTVSYNGTGDGVVYWCDSGGGLSHIENNTVHDVAASGFRVHNPYSGVGTVSYIQNNTIYNTGTFGIYHDANYYIIQNNTVHDVGTVGTANWGIGVQSEAADSGTGQHNIVRYNTIYNVKGDNVDACGLMLDHWTTANDVYYNLSYNNQGTGMTVYNATASNIYNNVFYGNNTSGLDANPAEISLGSTSNLLDTITVKNNVGYSTTANKYAIMVNAEATGKTLTITNNDWYRASGNWYKWGATAGATLGTWNGYTDVGTDLNADPLFVSPSAPDFHLQSGSPAINAGTDVGLTQDYAGHAIVGNPDIGAYEYVSGDAIAPAAPSGLSVN